MWHGPKKDTTYEIICDYQVGPFDARTEKMKITF